MKKQLLKLFNEAGFHQPEMERLIVEHKFEKFAELIVQECAELFEVEYGTSEVSGNEVARVLKEHFGVE